MKKIAMKIKIAQTVIGIATLLFYPIANADKNELALYEGDWTGSYQPDEGEREKATYSVKESNKEPGLSLTIQLGYFPKEDWAFEATELKVQSNAITFQFGKSDFQLECNLKKNNELELVGDCIPIGESKGSTAAKITMVPPLNKKKNEGGYGKGNGDDVENGNNQDKGK